MSHAVRRTTFVTAAAVAAIAVAAGTASASTVVTPAGQAVTASSSNLSIKTGTITLTCTSTTGAGTVPLANTNTGTGGVNVNIGTPSLTGCKANGLPAVVTTSGTWQLNVSGDAMPGGPAQGSLIIPANGAVVTLPGSTCTVTVVGSGPGGTGVSTIGPLPFDIPNQRVVAPSAGTGTVNYTRTGTGPVCPAAATGTATMSGTLQFASSTPINVTP
ncbi:hypothetical protein [Rhodococcus erythropolis]|uniref:Secreted protein n=1 Tax=Rhodococcus erythropolis TaxID=1833 RepID=A0AAX3ZZ41_RHOER|nr:hypothetical protein [Rhodococcus erythropolis]WMN02141.1 hypothetical protein QIE55_32960 [Rhodococcus erythropolis]WMN03116.1 hypothetical protein QIE55_32450 [Rhodococcus erythropolis]